MAQLQEQRQQWAALMAQRSVQMARLQTEQGVDDELMGRAWCRNYCSDLLIDFN